MGSLMDCSHESCMEIRKKYTTPKQYTRGLITTAYAISLGLKLGVSISGITRGGRVTHPWKVWGEILEGRGK